MSSTPRGVAGPYRTLTALAVRCETGSSGFASASMGSESSGFPRRDQRNLAISD